MQQKVSRLRGGSQPGLTMFWQQSQYDSRLGFSFRVLVRITVRVRSGLELVIGLWLG